MVCACAVCTTVSLVLLLESSDSLDSLSWAFTRDTLADWDFASSEELGISEVCESDLALEL